MARCFRPSFPASALRSSGRLAARASSGLADAMYGSGRIVSAYAAYESCVRHAHGASTLSVLAVNRPMLAIVGVFMVKLTRSLEDGELALRTATELSHARATTLAHGGLSLAAFYAGDAERSRRHAEAALELVRPSGNAVFEANGHYYAARAAIELGDTPAAVAHAERAVTICRAGAMRFLGATCLATLARLTDEDGRRRALLAEAETSLAEGTLSFNRFWFRENAIEVALLDRDAGEIRRHAEALERAVSSEPFPWAQLVVARGRALADHLEGTDDRRATILERMRAAGWAVGLAALG